MILLAAAIQAAGQSYVIDEVCVGAERHYRIDGEKGSSYEWILTDSTDTNIPLTNPAGTPFTEIVSPGDTIFGNEINITWNDVGKFTLSSIQTSSFGCDTTQAGEINVFDQAIAFAGNAQTVCPGDSILLDAATADYYSSLSWTTSGDGTFNNDTILQPIYIPGTNDILNESVSLTLTANGLGKASACTPAISIVDFILIKPEDLRSTLDTTICSSQTPFEWRGNNFNVTTSQSDTILSIHGCDSVTTLNLTVIPISYSTTDTIVCENDLPFVWLGNDYLATGSYNDTITNSAGCDSILTLNLTVNENTFSTIDTTVCETNLPFVWLGNDYLLTGSYNDTIPNTAGCDSIMTLNLTVLERFIELTDTVICENNTPFTWRGNDYFSSISESDTILNPAGCDSIYSLILTVIPNTFNTVDTTICENDLPFVWLGKDYLITGSYNDTIPGVAGCDSIITLNLAVNENTYATIDTTICETNLPFIWFGNDYLSTGSYNDTITNMNGCDSIMTLNLIIEEQFEEVTDTIICDDALPFNWRGTDYFSSITHSETITNPSGCDSIFTLLLDVRTETNDTIYHPICDSQVPYAWGSHVINSDGLYTDTFKNIAGCDSIVTLDISITAQVLHTIDSTICSSELPFSWNTQTISTAGTYSEAITTAFGCDSIVTLNLNVEAETHDTIFTQICTAQVPYNWGAYSINASGLYTETFTSASGCDSTITLDVLVAPQVVDTIYLDICDTNTPYSWASHSISTSGLYNDTLLSISGCDSIVTLKATVLETIETNITQTVCENDLPYSWNGQTITSAGTYSAVLNSVTNCDSTVNLTLSINQIVLTYSFENVICKGDNSGSINLSVSGGSGSYSYSWNNGSSSQDISKLYAGTYTVTVTDDSNGCYETLSVTITEPAIADHERPTLTAPANIEVECASSWTGAYNNLSQFRAAGGVASDNYNLDENSFTLIKVDTIKSGNRLTLERTYQIRDICDNRQTTVHRLTSTDDIPPAVNCSFLQVSISVNGTYELTNADIDSIADGTYDNCTPYDQLKFEVTPGSFDCNQVGEMIEYTLTVTDLNGNRSQCTNLIAVADNYIPQISCKDVTLYLNENGNLQINDPYGLLSGLTENCGIDSIFIDKTEFNCSDAGVNPVTISARDVNGLVSLPCISNVTVLDTISPEVIIQNITIYLDDSEQKSITPDQIDNGSNDACGIDNISLSKSDFTCADLGDNTVTLTVTDINGNIATETAIVTVIPLNEKPVAEDDLVQTIQDIPVSFYPYENDNDPDGTIDISSFALVIEPQHGTISFGVNDSLVYTPDPSYFGEDFFSYRICDDGVPCVTLCDTAQVELIIHEPNTPPIANIDQFASGCFTIFGDLLENDSDPDGHDFKINTSPILLPNYGTVSIYADGTFSYQFDPPLMVTDSFIYEICDIDFDPKCDQATVYLNIFLDNDCDRIDDMIDIDDDNDGITDVMEGSLAVDSDGDGIPNSLDIDSDNDGIPDLIEAQPGSSYTMPSGIDDNQNGLDDIYETDVLGLVPVDSDNDGIPDYLDNDSDNDGVPDEIEGYDLGAKGIAEVLPEDYDNDADGFDNGYDGFDGSFNENNLDNPFGSTPHLQDFDNDGIPDWRDEDDDNDGILTKYEDLNNNGIYYDDDRDFDGHPEYLDYMGDCNLFIPEGFSPDGDGINDYLQIYCIHKYPNAKLMIFHRNGDMIYEKEHYGNQEYWGSYENSWWDGKANQVTVEPDVYLYILDKGSGKLERGFVMVSY